jgi:hypothetical protein
MARTDKSAKISAAIDAIKRGEFANYANTAKEYGYDRGALSRRIRGLTKTKKEANSFYH